MEKENLIFMYSKERNEYIDHFFEKGDEKKLKKKIKEFNSSNLKCFDQYFYKLIKNKDCIKACKKSDKRLKNLSNIFIKIKNLLTETNNIVEKDFFAFDKHYKNLISEKGRLIKGILCFEFFKIEIDEYPSWEKRNTGDFTVDDIDFVFYNYEPKKEKVIEELYSTSTNIPNAIEEIFGTKYNHNPEVDIAFYKVFSRFLKDPKKYLLIVAGATKTIGCTSTHNWTSAFSGNFLLRYNEKAKAIERVFDKENSETLKNSEELIKLLK